MSGFDPPIVMPVSRSKTVAVTLLIVHVGALIPLWIIDEPTAQLVLALVTLFSLSANAHYLDDRHPRRVRQLVLGLDGEFHVTTGEIAEAARLRVASVVLPGLTVMLLRGDSGRHHRVVLLPDNCPEEPFRRLRVRLRLDNRVIDGGDGDAAA